MSKFDLKPKVIALRKSGKSIRDISTIVGIAKSTASIWCKDIELSKSQEKELIEKMKKMGRIGALKGAQANKNKKIKAKKDAKIWANHLVGSLSIRDKLIAGIALYWAEGSKAETTTGFIFVNSDPVMIKYMHDWLIDIVKIPKEEIVAKVSINEIHQYRIDKVLNFWSNLLDLPLDCFSKTFFATSVQKKVYENHEVHYGVLRLSVRRSTLLKYKVLGLIETLKAGVAQVVRADAS